MLNPMSVAVITLALNVSDCHHGYDEPMARWEPNAPDRLREAALELFEERGFEQTTVAEIAARAGLTERTFFRHFTDKREVLFRGSEGLRDTLVAAIDGAPAGASPLATVTAALDAAGAVFTPDFAAASPSSSPTPSSTSESSSSSRGSATRSPRHYAAAASATRWPASPPRPEWRSSGSLLSAGSQTPPTGYGPSTCARRSPSSTSSSSALPPPPPEPRLSPIACADEAPSSERHSTIASIVSPTPTQANAMATRRSLRSAGRRRRSCAMPNPGAGHRTQIVRRCHGRGACDCDNDHRHGLRTFRSPAGPSSSRPPVSFVRRLERGR